MATVEDLDEVIERCQQAMREFGKGNPEPMKGERDEIVDLPLRVTIIFRLEDDIWKVVHRHTDTVVSPRPHESMIKE